MALPAASSAEIIEAWRCSDGTAVTLRGTAVVKLLDGQDFDFVS
ncbi:hypothetical protein [Streptomyces sp. NBC_01643]|nr:hypothetical protein OHB03_16380 [Streptomyces sp. NBC_01643]